MKLHTFILIFFFSLPLHAMEGLGKRRNDGPSEREDKRNYFLADEIIYSVDTFSEQELVVILRGEISTTQDYNTLQFAIQCVEQRKRIGSAVSDELQEAFDSAVIRLNTELNPTLKINNPTLRRFIRLFTYGQLTKEECDLHFVYYQTADKDALELELRNIFEGILRRTGYCL